MSFRVVKDIPVVAPHAALCMTVRFAFPVFYLETIQRLKDWINCLKVLLSCELVRQVSFLHTKKDKKNIKTA